MGCCSDCDKGLPCSGDGPKAIAMTGNAGAPTGVGQTARNRRVTTPLQAAMTARTNLAVLSGGHHVRTVGLPIGVGQANGGCP